MINITLSDVSGINITLSVVFFFYFFLFYLVADHLFFFLMDIQDDTNLV